jgi:hypothetical protein
MPRSVYAPAVIVLPSSLSASVAASATTVNFATSTTLPLHLRRCSPIYQVRCQPITAIELTSPLDLDQAFGDGGPKVRDDIRRLMLFAASGFAYGLSLAFLGFVATGLGHGSYVLIGLVSAPLSLSGNFAVALFGAPLLWCALGTFLGTAWGSSRRIAFFLAMLLAHYASLPFVLRPPGVFADWDYVPRVVGPMRIGIAVYAAGQVALWTACGIQMVRRRR